MSTIVNGPLIGPTREFFYMTSSRAHCQPSPLSAEPTVSVFMALRLLERPETVLEKLAGGLLVSSALSTGCKGGGLSIKRQTSEIFNINDARNDTVMLGQRFPTWSTRTRGGTREVSREVRGELAETKVK